MRPRKLLRRLLRDCAFRIRDEFGYTTKYAKVPLYRCRDCCGVPSKWGRGSGLGSANEHRFAASGDDPCTRFTCCGSSCAGRVCSIDVQGSISARRIGFQRVKRCSAFCGWLAGVSGDAQWDVDRPDGELGYRGCEQPPVRYSHVGDFDDRGNTLAFPDQARSRFSDDRLCFPCIIRERGQVSHFSTRPRLLLSVKM
jgi:hypothetical protein